MKAKPGRGRPTFQPTAAHHLLVKNLTLLGSRESTIASCIGISVETFRKYFPERVKYREQMLGKIAQSAYQKALKGDTGMICFVLKTQAGWRETGNVHLTGGVQIIKRVIGVPDEAV